MTQSNPSPAESAAVAAGADPAEPKVASAERDIAAPAAVIFALIADPSQQPRFDGNDNLSEPVAGEPITAVGQVFSMRLTNAAVRENHVVEFTADRLIAWCPAEPGGEPVGHRWRWELEPIDDGHTRVRHTYDWSQLSDPARFTRARATTPDKLRASLDRLAAVAETDATS